MLLDDIDTPARPLLPLRLVVKEVKIPDFIASIRLPQEVPCYIHHADGRCTCTAPQIVNSGHAEACLGASMYTLSALKTDAKPRSGLTRDDLDFLAWSTAKIAGHWGRLALGQHESL